MKVEQIYTGCLAQGAYYIKSKNEVAIIDPLREIKPYLERSERDGAKIKYIFETHFHADFVSGHVDLSRATGAPIIYGPNANPSFEAIIAVTKKSPTTIVLCGIELVPGFALNWPSSLISVRSDTS